MVPQPDFWQKYVKMYIKTSFFELISKFQKDFKDLSAGIGILKNKVFKFSAI